MFHCLHHMSICGIHHAHATCTAHSSVCDHFHCFHVLSLVNDCCSGHRVEVFSNTGFLWINPQEWGCQITDGVLSGLWNCHTVLYRDCRLPFTGSLGGLLFSIPSQLLLFAEFLRIAVVTGARRYLVSSDLHLYYGC